MPTYSLPAVSDYENTRPLEGSRIIPRHHSHNHDPIVQITMRAKKVHYGETGLKSTLVGPYPRVGSECGDKLRRELNRLYEGNGDPELVRSLRKDLTGEVVREMVAAGISLPNSGLIDVHDELTWPLEHADGVRFGGMKKIFHTNIHYRQALVDSEVQRKEPLVGNLYKAALRLHPRVKVEFPGPFTMAKHSVLGKDSPYRDLNDLAEAYARLYREELSSLKDAPLVQFNEPSMIAPGARIEDMGLLPELYSKMLSGLDVPVAVWTFYGKYSPKALETLLSMPVDVVGLDFAWDTELDTQLRKGLSCDKGIGIGVIDSGDRGYVQFEDPTRVLERVSRMSGHVDIEESFLSCNATLEHLPRDYARRKAALIGEIARRISA